MASRFWVGGTGTWDNATTTNWSASTGGAGGASVPAAADAVTFDGSSGGGVVTVAATINGSNTISSLTMGAFTGTLDFSVNNPSVSMGSMSISGAGTRTLKLGSGTFTLTAPSTTNIFDASTTTGLTFLCGTSTIAFVPSSTPNNSFGMAGGGLTYNNVSFTFGSSAARAAFITGNNTINVLTIGPNINMQFSAGATQTLTSLVANGAAGSSGLLLGGASGVSTISIASGSINLIWIGVRSLTFSGGATFAAANSLDLGGNTGITITPPSSGSHMIGG